MLFGHASRHKINMQKSIVYVQTSSEQSENEILKTNPFKQHHKNKIVRNGFLSIVQDLYTKEKSLKETEELNK